MFISYPVPVKQIIPDPSGSGPAPQHCLILITYSTPCTCLISTLGGLTSRYLPVLISLSFKCHRKNFCTSLSCNLHGTENIGIHHFVQIHIHTVPLFQPPWNMYTYHDLYLHTVPHSQSTLINFNSQSTSVEHVQCTHHPPVDIPVSTSFVFNLHGTFPNFSQTSLFISPLMYYLHITLLEPLVHLHAPFQP
jgi:hypothetical protein